MFRSVSFRFSPAHYLPVRFRVLTASSGVAPNQENLRATHDENRLGRNPWLTIYGTPLALLETPRDDPVGIDAHYLTPEIPTTATRRGISAPSEAEVSAGQRDGTSNAKSTKCTLAATQRNSWEHHH
ncbi:MAG: hypothetical protein QOD10_5213 [Mycobacterium sp.]|jgi:hypothetical protein|nr:hypothetical protein [Mycobacterium sp.]